MAAYAAVISLKHTINGLLNSSSHREILEFAYDETTSLQQVLERLNDSSRSRSSMERLDAMEGQIRDSANKLEDILELNQTREEEEVRKEITCFGETAKKTAKDYIEELSRSCNDVDDDTVMNSASSDISDSGTEMVGRSDEFNLIQEKLLRKMRPVDKCYYSFWGEKGSGRTKVLRNIYEDLSSCRGEYFECWAWVTVGPTKHHRRKQALMSIIAQVEVDFINLDDELLDYISEDELSEYLYKALENRRYMIALDDVDDAELVNYLRMTSFPDQGNGSLLLLTTTSNDVALLQADFCSFCKLPVRFFQECIWPPLRAFFSEFESVIITPEMEEYGKRIIENCRCSLIAAAKTLLFLSKNDKTTEQWRRIAADQENPIFTVADELSEISKIKVEMQSWDMNDKSREIIAGFISLWVDFSSDI